MSKEIKSIKFKQVRIIETEPNAKISDHGKFFAVQKEGSEIPDYWVGKEYVDSIKYKTPKILKRADGSVISEPEEGTTVVLITEPEHFEDKYRIQLLTFYKEHKLLLKYGYVFLKEDEHLAEKKAKMLTKQLEIQYEIDRLNAEEGENFGQIFYFRLSKNKEIVEVESTNENALNVLLFSNRTAETILAKYSQEELKQYLGIII
jgi:hypothetical protein